MRQWNPLRTTCFTLFWLLPVLAAAQSDRLETLSIRDGLSQGFVSALLQDREGFLWFGTKNGLNRYDGRRFKIFTADPADPFAISNDYILSVSEFGDFLLIGTNGGGLNIFHKKTQRFYRVPEILPNGESLASPLVFKAFAGGRGNIWVHFWKENTYLSGLLYKLKLPQGFWERLGTTEQPWEGVTVDKQYGRPFQALFAGAELKNLWLLDGPTVLCIDTQTDALDSFRLPVLADRVIIDTAGTHWVVSGNCLIKLAENGFQVLNADFPISHGYGFDRHNRLLINSKDEFLRFPAEKLTGTLLYKDAELHLKGVQGIQAITDRSGIVWLATQGYGLNKLSPRLGRFRTFFEGASIYSPPMADADGVTGYFDLSQTGFVTHPSGAAHLLKRLGATGVHHRYVQDRKGRHWMWFSQGRQHRLLRVNFSGNIEKQYFASSNIQVGGCMVLDRDGMIRVAHNGKFICLDPEKEQLAVFDYDAALPFGHEVRAMVQTDDGRWWFATEYGLIEAKPAGETWNFILHKQGASPGQGLRNENLSCLLVDPQNRQRLWIGTKGGGLACLDTRNGTFTHLTTRNGLPNEVIYGVLDDAEGKLWMSSNRGLIRYNPANGDIKNFTEADGLLSNEFNTWAYGKTPTGELMFGGVNGLHIFDPKNWQDNRVTPAVRLTGLLVNNIPVTAGDSTRLLDVAPEWTRRIVLPFAQNSVALEFAALEFTVPSKNRFRYYLEGAESPWAHEGYETSAQYLNLQPGAYTFKVMACNNDGVWNPEPAALEIVVLPPWYRSVWAYLGYLLIAAALIGAYLRFHLSRLRLRQQLALEHLQTERLREMDEFKSRFFTNVSHEFRTPLTVILGSAEQAKAELAQLDIPGARPPLAKLDLIRRSGENLLRLVNRILDLAKLESNTLKMENIQADVVPYLHYVAESLHSLANAKNILLRVESEVATLVMDYDPERLLQIVYNLLSNAVKFTPSGGRVTMRLQVTKSESGGQDLLVSVSDTGVGIPPDDLPFVFNRFFQAGNRASAGESGSGIGLSLTAELAKAMGGAVSVDSAVGKGSTFTVRLPVRRLATPASAPPVPSGSVPPQALPLVLTDGAPTDPLLLIIEDNPEVVEYLGSALGEGYRLEFAYNGRAGIEKAFETIPDIVVSDVMMPEKDGFEVCEALRNDERTSHIPIVLLTARAGVEDRIAGLRRGADAYLAKPFHPEELRVTLLKLIELRRSLQARFASSGPVAPALSETEKTEDAFLQKLRSAVESRLSDPGFSGEELCRALGMSYPVVYRKLSALTGRSLHLYIRLIRLQKARDMLLVSALGIAEIAYETGFNDPKFFSRVFSEEFGMPPSVFREKMGK